MEDKTPKEVAIARQIDTGELDSNITDITQRIISENSVAETQDLVNLFNWNLSKKNAIRLLKLNGLYDKITDQMLERFEKRSGEFSNNDLLSYLQTVENSMEKTQKRMSNQENVPTIHVQNNTQVNVNMLDSFDSDSKDRIAMAIKAFIANSAVEPTEETVDNTIVYEDKGESTSDEQNSSQQ